MKNNYRKLKLSILLQTVFVTALTILVGGFTIEYLLDGSSNYFVKFLTWIHVPEMNAKHWYWKIIDGNMDFFLVVGFLCLFSIFFYVSLSKMVKYLKQVEAGINNIVSDSTESIHMITELKPIETRLNEIKSTLKKQELEAIEGEKKKNDLVVFLAHDLKTPLTSIVAYLTMLDSYKDMPAEERERYTHIALEKSIRLGELISEFFEITKFNLQDIELEPMELNLSMMLEQLADELYGVLQEKNLTCEVDTEEDLKVYGDPDKLARVFDNILRNAVSYCYPGTKIQITAQKTEEGSRIVFSNHGDQIPDEKLNTIFEKFYRLDGSRHSTTGGAGLGLAIAKEIVELHGGTIWAESDETETRFVVTLPDQKEGRKMKFIHIADVHLGAEPEGLRLSEKDRGREIWDALERIVTFCEQETVDLLLIAGDLFHRQPLLRELKEVNYLFSKLTRTKVVLIAGNHDYIKLDSYYRTFAWNQNVYPLFQGHMESVEFPELKTCVYGLSYYQKEIPDALYDTACAKGKQKIEILLAHGGDEKHIPVNKEVLNNLGYDYIAMGHIHKPQAVIEDKAVYAGALEPIDKNDVGPHGYVYGEIMDKGVKTTFVPDAKREYIHFPVKVDSSMTNGALKEKIRESIHEYGMHNIYKIILTGFRDADIYFELNDVKNYGNIIEIVDETNPAYDFEKLSAKNQGNLLGRYIESFQDCEEGSVEYKALYEGVQALLETKRG